AQEDCARWNFHARVRFQCPGRADAVFEGVSFEVERGEEGADHARAAGNVLPARQSLLVLGFASAKPAHLRSLPSDGPDHLEKGRTGRLRFPAAGALVGIERRRGLRTTGLLALQQVDFDPLARAAGAGETPELRWRAPDRRALDGRRPKIL